MTLPPDRRFTLLHDGQLLVAETRRVGVEIDVRLSIGGKEVAAGRNWLEPVRLAHHDFIVEVRFTWLGQVTGVALVLHDESEIPFTPPPGSFAARLQALAVDYPALYASRRIVVALALLGGGLFGIWAILWAFLSTLGLPGPGTPWVGRSRDARLAEVDSRHPRSARRCSVWLDSVRIRRAFRPPRTRETVNPARVALVVAAQRDDLDSSRACGLPGDRSGVAPQGTRCPA